MMKVEPGQGTEEEEEEEEELSKEGLWSSVSGRKVAIVSGGVMAV